MTARTRARPRGTRAPRTNRKKRSRFSAAPLKRPELLAVAAGAVLVAASLFLFDIPALAADVRDSLARSLGLGIAVLLGWLAFAAYAVAKRNHQEPRHTTWAHEKVEQTIEHENFRQVMAIKEILPFLSVI